MVNTILKYLLNVLVFIKKMMNCLEKGEKEREKERERELNSFTVQGAKLAIGKTIQDEFMAVLTTEYVV